MDQGQGQSQNLELGADLLLVVCGDFGIQLYYCY